MCRPYGALVRWFFLNPGLKPRANDIAPRWAYSSLCNASLLITRPNNIAPRLG